MKCAIRHAGDVQIVKDILDVQVVRLGNTDRIVNAIVAQTVDRLQQVKSRVTEMMEHVHVRMVISEQHVPLRAIITKTALGLHVSKITELVQGIASAATTGRTVTQLAPQIVKTKFAIAYQGNAHAVASIDIMVQSATSHVRMDAHLAISRQGHARTVTSVNTDQLASIHVILTA